MEYFYHSVKMPNSCIVCGKIKAKGKTISMHRFPTDPSKKSQWLKAVNLNEGDIHEHTRICSVHFLYGDTSSAPSLCLGNRFASPKKLQLSRGQRSLKRQKTSPTPPPKRPVIVSERVSSSRSRTVTPAPSDTTDESDRMSEVLSVSVGEPLLSDYSIHDLPDEENTSDHSTNLVLMNSHIEALRAENHQLEVNNRKLKSEISSTKSSFFRLEDVASDDKLIKFYTGFTSYEVLLLFFEFLGPSVHNLNYWGSSNTKTTKRRRKKLDPINQFFLTLIKLRLNLRIKDLAYRFGISTGLVSRYITTWICFLYHHLKEINWIPSVEQVVATLPVAFRSKYAKTFVIIDASEIFLEVPSDLHLQSSTWSNYKHHNTAKFLVGCTPNGSISYVSSLYVGSISDVELTRVSGFLQQLEGKSGVSVMADRGFTIQRDLHPLGITLNIPPFMEGRDQLPAEEVQKGRQIASLRIHVERVIGRIKNFSILTSTLPLSMARLSNQIVCVCAWLTNFHPAVVPLSDNDQSDEDVVVNYFESLYESDYDADTDESEEEL